jgi:hypothetical protein
MNEQVVRAQESFLVVNESKQIVFVTFTHDFSCWKILYRG